jgi:hypothetical protein
MSLRFTKTFRLNVELNSTASSVVEGSWNVMAHAQKPDFVFRRKGRVHLNRRGRHFSRLLAAEVCASAVVMLDTPSSEVVWRVLATHSIRQFPLHFPYRASPCAITFQLQSTKTNVELNSTVTSVVPSPMSSSNRHVTLRAHPASYTMGTGCSWGLKRPRHDADHPSSCIADIVNGLKISLCVCIGMSWSDLYLYWPTPHLHVQATPTLL